MSYENRILKNHKLLGTTPDEVPRFIIKKWIQVHGQSGFAEDKCKSSKQIRFKISMLQRYLCDFRDAYIVYIKELLLLQIQIMMHVTKNYLLQRMHCLFLEYTY